MRLAILIGHFPPAAYGGAELQAEGWARRLSARHEVTVITRADHMCPAGRETRDGFAIVRTVASPIPGWRTLADLFAIEAVLASLEPRPDVLLCFQTFISGWAGTRAGRRMGLPVIVWVRGESEYRLGDSLVHRWVSPRVWTSAAGVLVQSEANRGALLSELERHAPSRAARIQERLDVVANGLDLPAVSPSPAVGPVLSVGRLIADKGMDVVIHACVRAGRPLVIAGTGPEREPLEVLARSLGADVRFAGHADRASLDALYTAASVVVLAAHRGEGLPNVLLEAMAHARPVVSTPCAGARDLLQHGSNGLLVPPGEVEALSASLSRLAADPALGARLAAAGRTTAERFEWSRVEPQLEAVLARRMRP